MGKKGGRRHLKRKPAPEFWPIHRKEALWTIKPNPGAHPIHRSIPLTLVLRDVLGYAETRGEARTILHDGKIIVDGKIQQEELFPTGLMDVISIPSIDKSYRVLPSEKGLHIYPVGEAEAAFKLCRIENKTVLNGGHVQLNLHDGRNLLIKVKDASKPEEDVFETLESVKISLPSQELLDHMKVEEGVTALIVDGKNAGKHGKVIAVDKRQKRRVSLVTIEDKERNRYQTTMDYVFVVGGTKPEISLPEVS